MVSKTFLGEWETWFGWKCKSQLETYRCITSHQWQFFFFYFFQIRQFWQCLCRIEWRCTSAQEVCSIVNHTWCGPVCELITKYSNSWTSTGREDRHVRFLGTSVNHKGMWEAEGNESLVIEIMSTHACWTIFAAAAGFISPSLAPFIAPSLASSSTLPSAIGWSQTTERKGRRDYIVE